MDISNKFVFLNLKYENEEDNFNTGEEKPFLIRKIKENKVYLIPITLQEKKSEFPLQYLISNPQNPTCLTSKKYPYSYANLNQRIIIKFVKEKGFPDRNFCGNCLSKEKFENLILLYKEY
jgi:hypothetical protein